MDEQTFQRRAPLHRLSSESVNQSYPGKELEVMSHAVNYHRWIVKELTPYLGNTAVEVGAGIGDLSRLLLTTPIRKLFAFEPSSDLCDMLRENLRDESRVTVVNDFLDRSRLQDGVDSVLYINVLEHIENDREELLKVAGVVKAGASLLIFVPALSWLFSGADRSVGHFRRYHRKPLISLVEECGFRVEKARYFDLMGVIPWYLNFVLLKNTFDAGSVALYDKLVVPPMRVFEKVIRPPIGKNILLVARKT